MLKINHENVLKAFSYEMSDEHIYITLERCDTDLKKILDFYSQIRQERGVASIIRMLGQGLEELRKSNILHRDLKPANMLFIGGAGGVLKICDFGCAKELEEDQESTDTLMVQGIGSTAYAAPEFKFAKQGYSGISEMWPVGCILVEMMFGHDEFQRILKDVRQCEQKKTEFKLTLPIEKVKISSHCIDVLKGLVQPDPNKRMSLQQLMASPFLNSIPKQSEKEQLAEAKKEREALTKRI